MRTIQFKCELLTDVVLSQKAATEGSQATLDYLPGNVFLGIVAGKIYTGFGKMEQAEPDKKKLAISLFHNGDVRFGDAHPLSLHNERAVRVPAAWFIHKGGKLKDKNNVKIYFNKTEGNTQCRREFISHANENRFEIIETGKSFAIKSAYDREKRRSKDEQMYGYQSLTSGSIFGFEVEFADTVADADIAMVKECLTGEVSVGRSKTAQYGRVRIFESSYKQSFAEHAFTSKGLTYLYAESRLHFFDDKGQPFIPLDGCYWGMCGAQVVKDKSQIRTFRYAPYNKTRECRDADRYGIEKGSVICLNREATPDETEKIKQGVGTFKNEGFGRIRINPGFLQTIGEAEIKYSYFEPEKGDITDRKSYTEVTDPKQKAILEFLKKEKQKAEEEKQILNEVNQFVKEHKKLFTSGPEEFSSQWGTIRGLAARYRDKSQLKEALFSEDKSRPGYLRRGTGAQKWQERGRLRRFEVFFDKLPVNLASKAVINLGAEMAKIIGNNSKEE